MESFSGDLPDFTDHIPVEGGLAMLCMTFPQFLAGEALSLGICPALPVTSPAPAGEAPASNAADAQGHLGFYVSAEGLHDKSCAWAETQKPVAFATGCIYLR